MQQLVQLSYGLNCSGGDKKITKAKFSDWGQQEYLKLDFSARENVKWPFLYA